jgi:uncharacterized membrane protein YtjA (UPF0391 family)
VETIVTIYTKGKLFITWAVIFLVTAVVLALLGFTGVGAHAAWIFNTLVIVFLILFGLFLLIGSRSKRT